MQFIYDNLIAVIVSMTLAVALLSQQTGVRQETLERQSVYDAKVKALAFAEWLEDDVATLGARFGRSRERFRDSTVLIGGEPTTRRFEYYYYESNADAGNVVQRTEIRYTLLDDGRAFAGLRGRDSVHVPFYRLVRERRTGRYHLGADGSGAWVGSAPLWGVPPGYTTPRGLSRFLVEPLDSDGRAAPTPQDADYVRLHFAVVPTMFPLHRARLIPASGLFWGTTIEIRPY